MKRLFYYSLISVVSLGFLSACQKETAVEDTVEAPATEESDVTPTKKQVTISATIPENGLETKVSFEEQDTNPGGSAKYRLNKLSWEESDVLQINGEDFTIDWSTISVDKKSANFTGTEPAPIGGKYTVSYNSISGTLNEQTQKADGDASYLGYSVSIANLASFPTTISFDPSIHGANMTQSSVLQLRALLSSTIAPIAAIPTFLILPIPKRILPLSTVNLVSLLFILGLRISICNLLHSSI